MPQLTAEFNCSAQRIWEVLTSYEEYSKHLQGVKRVREVSRQGNRVLLEYNVEVMKPVTYQIELVEEKPTKMHWELYSGSVFKKNSGSWEIKSLGDNRVQVTYTLEVEFGIFVPKFLLNTLVSTQMPKALDDFRRWAENA